MADYANFVGVSFGLVGFALLGLVKGSEHWRLSTLLVGILLIVLASLSLGTFTDMNGMFDLLEQTKKIDLSTHKEAKTSVGIWVFVLPAVVASIGANLISAWFLAKRPN